LLIRPAETKPTSPDIFQCGRLTESNVPIGILCRGDLKSDCIGPLCPHSPIPHLKSGVFGTWDFSRLMI